MKSRNIILISLAFLISFSVIIYFGKSLFGHQAPVPRAVATHHELLFTHEDIEEGKNIWHSLGVIQTSSRDWLKDWHFRESLALLDIWSLHDLGKLYKDLDEIQQTFYKNRLKTEFLKSEIDPDGRLTLSNDRAKAVKIVSQYYVSLFKNDKNFEKLGDESVRKILAYFFWKSWSISSTTGVTDNLDEIKLSSP